MTNLEFINQNIFECKNCIEHLENKIIEDKKYPSLVKPHKERIEELKLILNQLQQIKNILEAWESVKELIRNSGGIYLLRVDSDDEDDKEHYKRIEKALEVKNNE